jgi:UDP-N-acetylglucosamine 2-epimerase
MGRRKPTVVSIVGARPQFVKLAPVAACLKTVCHHRIVHSGQHYDRAMSDVFFDQLQLPAPDINLNVGSGDHGRQTARILERCEKALKELDPGLVLVYGDTNTTVGGALAAAKLNIPVGHIEAGLRSFRMTMPEEVNRRVTDHLSSLLFYPTPAAKNNLIAEGIKKGLVNSGDVMYQILDMCLPIVNGRKSVYGEVGVEEQDYILITIHRAENADDPERVKRFIRAIQRISDRMVFPAHPRVRKNLRRFGLMKAIGSISNLIMCRPQPYIESLALIAGAKAVLTDSGGMQKEAYFLGVPCLTLRPVTEWVETVDAGANVLVDMSPQKISRALHHLPKKPVRLKRYTIRGKKPSAVISSAVAAFLDNR